MVQKRKMKCVLRRTMILTILGSLLLLPICLNLAVTLNGVLANQRSPERRTSSDRSGTTATTTTNTDHYWARDRIEDVEVPLPKKIVGSATKYRCYSVTWLLDINQLPGY